ncbi:MAG: hypothetical protein A2X28_09115 [Elusimicrobia bacterium GWA2_56_46]|nr:MAG: hypothetical protein A2X28_09115 [Elusimicrobia bacterium GWA2_56_46]OGR54463.1 MAG: hypothetical protein A2X39_04195 [Elusimicrobia bacterium GWC2_56_31]HBB67439.1 hypothetical protein [Elusimicrobiota bacterium]HBW22557.1 hypothetical protein [Elusimicrobiota bacterium]
MKNFSGWIAWFLLAAVLVVPSFLFYNWWIDKSVKEAAAQASVQSVSAAGIFGRSQDAAPSVQAASTVPAAAVSAIPAPAAEPPAPPKETPRLQETARVPAAGPEPGRRDFTVGGGTQVLRPSSAPVQEAAAERVPAKTAAGSYFSPKSARDPMLSPEDYQKMKDEEAQRLETERQRRLTLARQLKESSGETRIKLQGIVGNSAIVNGEMHLAGDTVAGVKLLKIGPNYVIGEYKGKRFKKILR